MSGYCDLSQDSLTQESAQQINAIHDEIKNLPVEDFLTAEELRQLDGGGETSGNGGEPPAKKKRATGGGRRQTPKNKTGASADTSNGIAFSQIFVVHILSKVLVYSTHVNGGD